MFVNRIITVENDSSNYSFVKYPHIQNFVMMSSDTTLLINQLPFPGYIFLLDDFGLPRPGIERYNRQHTQRAVYQPALNNMVVINVWLFFLTGRGPFPGVIDIMGAGGGLLHYQGALLASKGFVVLCLAYYKYDDLPIKPQDVTFDYFIVRTTFFFNIFI